MNRCTKKDAADTDGELLVVVATVDGLVTAYKGTTNPLYCFRTRGPVLELHFSDANECLIALETLGRDATEVDYEFKRNERGLTSWVVRAGPSSMSPTVATLAIDDVVVVTHVEAPWMRVRLQSGITGWTTAGSEGQKYLTKTSKQAQRVAARLYSNWYDQPPALLYRCSTQRFFMQRAGSVALLYQIAA